MIKSIFLVLAFLSASLSAGTQDRKDFESSNGNQLRLMLSQIDEGTETIYLDTFRRTQFKLNGKKVPAAEVTFRMTSPFLGEETGYFKAIILNEPWQAQIAYFGWNRGLEFAESTTIVSYELN